MAPAWIGVSVAALLGSACATAARLAFSEPTVAVEEIRVEDLSLTGGTLGLVLAVEHANPYSLRALRTAVDLDLGGTRFGTAELPGSVVLEPGGQTLVTVPLTFRWSGVGAAARSLLGTGRVAYTATGTMYVAGPLGEIPLALQLAGEVTVTEVVR